MSKGWMTFGAVLCLAACTGQEEDVHGRVREDWLRRVYPKMSYDPAARYQAWLDWQALPIVGLPVGAQDGGDWVNIGPDTLIDPVAGHNTGRVTAVAVHPSNPSTVYIGTSEGGVWKTSDAGTSWSPLTDKQPSLQCETLAVDPFAVDTIYAGTGSMLPLFTHSNVVRSWAGFGLLRSTDGGATWTLLGQATFLGQAITKVVPDPTKRDRLFIAASNGVWITDNAGQTFRLALSGFCTDLELLTGNTLFAALGDPDGAENNGVYRSTNTGQSWSVVGTMPSGPQVGRIEIALSPSNNNIAYSVVSQAYPFSTLLGTYKTTNKGVTWDQTTAQLPSDVNYHWFCLTINVHPTNPDVVFFGSLYLYRSINGGLTWDKLSGSYHVDQHEIAFAPSNPDVLYVGNDGGIIRGSNLAGTISWTDVSDSLANTLFYSVATHPSNPNVAIGGLQDNGVAVYSGSRDWANYNYADGIRTVIDKRTPARMYFTIQNARLFRSTNSGANWNLAGPALERSLFLAPLVTANTSPLNSLYLGTYRVWKSTNGADSWSPISGDLTKNGDIEIAGVSAIGVAPSDNQLIYAGTGDGKLWTSSSGGAGWTDLSVKTPNRWVGAIAVHPTDPLTAFVGFAGQGAPHLYRTVDGGGTFQDVSANLPDLAINDLQFDPTSPNIIYVATELGVLVGDGNGAWFKLGADLPNVAVTGIAPNATTNLLRVSTMGRGVWQAQQRRYLPLSFDFQDWLGADQAVVLDLISPTTDQVVGTWYVVPSGGELVLADVPNGRWLARARSYHWLSQVQPIDTTLGDPPRVSFSLVNGDANLDNRVDIFDMVACLLRYGENAEEPMDIDGSGLVDLYDLTIVLRNFGRFGE